MDLYLSGLIESSKDGKIGETFKNLFKDQFERIRRADYYWYENYENNKLLDESENLTKAFNDIQSWSFRKLFMFVTTNRKPVSDTCPDF